MKTIRRFLLASFLVLILALFVLPVMAQDGEATDDEVNEVARDIYCPVCENTPLDVCQTKACADWRELIRTKLSAGDSEQDIYDYFARQYGDGVLANPPRRGVSLVILWVLPVVLILLGLLVFGRYMRGLRGVEPHTATAAGPDADFESSAAKPKPAQDDYMARVEEELKRTDE